MKFASMPSTLAVLLLIISAPWLGSVHAQEPARFSDHLDALIPRLLEKTGVPGAAVAVIRHGEVAFVHTWGFARVSTGAPIRKHTLFNVGSIAKPLTAWGVMKLVEDGMLELDAPVADYLSGWRPPESEFDPTAITVRRLLSHTAGLNVSAVPSLPVDSPYPSTVEAINDPALGLAIVSAPGSVWSYSGGGFMVLQLLVEEASGRPFAEYMRREVLDPLNLVDTRFGLPPEAGRGGVAQPYEDGVPTSVLKWPGVSAAGLYTTPSDLAAFVAASLVGQGGASGKGRALPLSTETVRLLASPAPGTERPYTTRYGLGHDLWPLPGGGFAAGHNGQNTGWSAAAWWIPETGDGVVILTNDSNGMAVHRWVLCDWIAWARSPAFGGYCAGRDQQPAGTLELWPGPDSSEEGRSSWSRKIGPGEPGGAMVVRRWGREVMAEARGSDNLGTGSPIHVDTPFYIASVAKPLTASLVSLLEERGLIDPTDRLGAVFPEIPTLDSVTVRQLANHTAGVPDYFGWIEWARFRRLSDGDVIDTLAAHPALEAAPGTRFDYSNSHYVLLSELIRRTTGTTLRTMAMEEYGAPLGLVSLYVDDSDDPLPVDRALGYVPDGDSFRLSSYEEIDLPGPAPTVQLQFATTGAGGVFMSARDLAGWGEAVAPLVARRAGEPVPLPEDYTGAVIGKVLGYDQGWFVSRLGSYTVFWHSGNRGGYGAFLAVVPRAGLTVAFVANRSDLDPTAIVQRELRARLEGSDSA